MAETKNTSARQSLEGLRVFTMGLWLIFPIVSLVMKLGMCSTNTEEWVWTIMDFFGKAIFSSSLLQGNFLTMEQRRLIAMRVVEEGNRIRVIQELKDVVEQKERFMSSLSHELRTPLNGIIGLSDSLLVGSCSDMSEQTRKTITTIKTSGSRLLNLINDILDAAAMRMGKLTVKHEKVNLSRIVDDVLELTRPLAKRGVLLINNVPASIPPVLGDTGRIIQIFNNLVGNSCKFTHRGAISITANKIQEMVEVSVCDTGIGIHEEKYDKIFNAFEQVDMSTTRKYGGTGLGLNLVKQLVEAHGGTINIRSKIGVGTTFSFTLKIWDQEKANASQAEDVFATSGGSADTGAGVGGGALGDTAPKPPRKRASRGSSLANLSQRLFNPQGPLAQMVSATQAAEATKVPLESHVTKVPSTNQLDVAPRSPTQKSNNNFQVLQPLPRHDEGVEVSGSQSQVVHWPVRKIRKGPVRVLSVDDDPVNQLVIENLLVPEGYEVRHAMDGQSALDMLSEMDMPDLILLDVMMPGMSGYEVCRKLRELYPTSCVPIIMVSAKSKEDHIVEGLAAGANDYVVKPFGRQEILARIAAHLKFKEAVVQAGDKAPEVPRAEIGEQFRALMEVESKQFSLPASIKTLVENSTGVTQTVHMYDNLTMVVMGVHDLEKLAQNIASEDLTGALTSLYIYLEDLLQKHNCYLVDGVEGRIVIVAGLSGEQPADQVHQTLELSRELLDVANNMITTDVGNMQLSVGIHIAAAQGVIVGTNHPVFYITGPLPDKAAQLQATCPPNCIHVSQRVQDISGEPSQFVLGVRMLQGSDATYLHCSGDWQAYRGSLVKNFERYLSSHPFGPINSSALRLSPIQLALMSLVQGDPATLVELMSGRSPRSTQAGTEPKALEPSSDTPATEIGAPAQSGSKATPTIKKGSQLLTRLQHDKEVLERQLEEVSTEAACLQGLVDSLELELSQQQQQKHSVSQAAGTQQEAVWCEVEQLRLQLADCQSLKRIAEAQLQETERRAADMHFANTRLELQLRHQQQQLQQPTGMHTPPPLLALGSMPRSTRSSVMGHMGGALGAAPALPPLERATSFRAAPKLYRALTLPCPPWSVATSTWSQEGVGVMRQAAPLSPSPSACVPTCGTATPGLGPADSDQGIRGVLEQLGLGELAPKFEEEEVTPALLPYLDDAAMAELGAVSMGARVKLRVAARQVTQV